MENTVKEILKEEILGYWEFSINNNGHKTLDQIKFIGKEDGLETRVNDILEDEERPLVEISNELFNECVEEVRNENPELVKLENEVQNNGNNDEDKFNFEISMGEDKIEMFQESLSKENISEFKKTLLESLIRVEKKNIEWNKMKLEELK